MNTSQFITNLQTKIGDQYTREFLREVVNEAQNEVLAQNGVDIMRTKGDVYLETTSGVYTYTLANSVRHVSRVFIREKADEAEYSPDSYGFRGYKISDWVDSGTQRYVEKDLNFEYDGGLRYGDPIVLVFPADQDLGTTTTTYRLTQYTWPNQLTSENVPLSLPEPFLTGFFTYLIKKKVEEAAYGADIYNDPKFRQGLAGFLATDARRPRKVPPQRKVRF